MKSDFITMSTTKTFLKKIKFIEERLKTFISTHWGEFLVWIIVSLSTYGFELLHVHINIDEEIAALRPTINPAFITSGRWGLYVLSGTLLPKQIIPFVPLALALCFQFIGILLLLDCLNIQSHIERILIVAIGLTWPGLAYSLSFSISNFAIGFGFLCISLSLFILVKARKSLKLLAALPAALVFSIYQPLLQPLVMVFFLYALYRWKEERPDLLRFLISAGLTLGLGFVLYYAVQQIFLYTMATDSSNYVSHYFNIAGLFENLGWYLQKLTRLAYNIFVGDSSFYGIAIRSLPIFLLFAGILILVTHYKHREKVGNHILFLSLLVIFTLLPFIGGILTKGYIPYRSLLGVPVFLMGWAALALKYARPSAKLALGILALFTLFQFASSANHLFASSAFAYEEDKLLAYQLVGRIEEEKARTSSPQVQYLEMIGFVERPSTPLVSRIENIGASFFGWDQGNSTRVVNFLSVLGYTSLDALPQERHAEFVIEGELMPIWPAPGSVVIIGNTVLVKFGPYSETQIKTICEQESKTGLPVDFCP